MGRRLALLVEANGERFRFYYDADYPVELHITRRHGTTPHDAINVFFVGSAEPWDDSRQRFETTTDTHVLFWTRHAHDQSVIVISCFRRETQHGSTD